MTPMKHREQPDAPATSAFRPDVEGLRAVAVLSVLAFHAGLPVVPGGFLGVDIFFVISGFLITGLLAREAARDGRISLTRFYARRAKRLLPAAVLVLVATALLSWWALPATRWAEIGGDLVASAAYVINWRLAARSVDYLAEDSVASPVQHYWSLAVEEQFYLLWPLLILVGTILVRRRRLVLRPVLVALLTLVVLLSFGWSVLQTAQHPLTAYFVTPTRLWELGVGGLVALTAHRWQRLRATTATGLVWLGLLAILLGLLLYDGTTAWPGAAAALPVLGTAAVIAGGFAARAEGPARVLGSPAMVAVGALSYSLYLWHWPVLLVATETWGDSLVVGLAAVTLCAVPAWLSYTWVENPIRRSALLARLPRVALVAGLACTVVGAGAGWSLIRSVESSIQSAAPSGEVLGAGALATGPSASSSTTPDQTAGESASPSSSRTQAPASTTTTDPGDGRPDLSVFAPDVGGFDTVPESITPDPLAATSDLPEIYARGCQTSVGSSQVIECGIGDADGTTRLALVGDSKAAQWADALDTIAQEQGWGLTTYLRGGCPLAEAEMDGDPTCAVWSDAVLERLLADPPDVVLVSSVRSTAIDADGEPSGKAMIKGHIATWEVLAEAGIPVIAISDSPQPGSRKVYECVAEHRDDVAFCAFTQNDGSGTGPLLGAVDAVPTAQMLDMNDWICPVSLCPPVIGNVLVYRQGSHLTNTYVVSLTEPLRARLILAVDWALAQS